MVDLYARWKVDCLNLNPDVLSILIGVNDTWHEKSERRNGVEVERYGMIYDMLLDWTVKTLPNIKLVLMEPFVLETGAVTADWVPEIAARAVIVKELAEKYNYGSAYISSEIIAWVCNVGAVVAAMSLVLSFVISCCTGGVFTIAKTIISFIISYVAPTLISAIQMLYYGIKKRRGCKYTFYYIGGASVSF